jgi:hypothetical protein
MRENLMIYAVAATIILLACLYGVVDLGIWP